jgi:hemin uptake protein HemP
MPSVTPPPQPASDAKNLNQRKIPSDLLLGGYHEVVIVHRGREYRLRVTQNGKLILTA